MTGVSMPRRRFAVERVIARNATWNLAGHVLPLLVAAATIPTLAAHLGAERFGVLTLVWSAFGYIGLFDLGLGRATTILVSGRLRSGRARSSYEIITSAAATQAAIGVIFSLVLVASADWLLRLLSLPPQLHRESTAALYWLAAALPFALVSIGLRGALEAAQRFDLVNVIRASGGTATFVLPAAVAAFGGQLSAMVFWLTCSRIFLAFASLHCLKSAIPGFRWHLPSKNLSAVRDLLSAGTWITVSNIVSPILVYGERFALATFAGVRAVGYYGPVSEAALRLLALPGSLATALLPAVATLRAQGALGNLNRIYRNHLFLLTLVLAPLFLVMIALAPALLAWWLGPEYAQQTGTVFRLLLLGIGINGLAHLPYTILHGVGRPDITAKLHLLELPLFVAAASILIQNQGITGAALTWTLRATLDALLLFIAAARVMRLINRQEGARAAPGSHPA